MCSWIAEGVQPLDEAATPTFDPKFKTHMMQGEVHAGSHSGLHSMHWIFSNAIIYQIKEGDKVLDTTCPEIYSAKVGLVKNSDDIKKRQADPKYNDEKLSSFFPDSMTFEEIEKAVKFAYQNYKGSSQGLIRQRAKHSVDQNTGLARVPYHNAQRDVMHAFGKQLVRLKVSETGGVKWAGRVKISNGKSKSWIVWIGSPQTGTTSSKLLTAFPTVLGKFL